MTKDEVVGALTSTRFAGYPDLPPVDQTGAVGQLRARVAADQWPLIVAFVAAWIEGLPLDAPIPLQIADRWRQEMA